MNRLPRFYLPTIPTAPSQWDVVLDKTQSHHLQNVLRLKPGAQVELFDNQGNCYLGEITPPPYGCGESQVHIKIVRSKSSEMPVLEITLATAIPKGRRMDWLVEKVSELGLTKLIPLVTRYSTARDKPSQSKLTRWQKIAIESAKQSGRNQILQITDILPFEQLTDIISGYDLKLVAHPQAVTSLNELLTTLTKQRRIPSSAEVADAPKLWRRSSTEGGRCSEPRIVVRGKDIIYLIGPEGGFSQEEIKITEGLGFKKVHLPCPGILRVETAAVAMLAMLICIYASSKTTTD